MTDRDLYREVERYLLTEKQLRLNDYPRPDSSTPGRIKLYGNHFGFQEDHCKRCDCDFDTTYDESGVCKFHYGKTRKDGARIRWTCCNRSHHSAGCTTVNHHVHLNNMYLEVDGYKKTPESGDDKNYGEIYALDTDSICTKLGFEVCRVTVVNVKKEVVYETFVKPTTEILDYNTWWSGITEGNLKGVEKTFDQMREDLLALFSSNTILVGHSLQCEILQLKIQHDKIIDTTVLYPHRLGPPRKRSLQELAEMELGRQLRTGAAGHDSRTEAIMCMDLVLKKIGRL